MTIRWTDAAIDQLHAIHTYIAGENLLAAGTIIDRILNEVEFLAIFPGIGRLGEIPDTRELVISRSPYIAIYRIRLDVIEVLAIQHGARLWPEFL